MPPQVPKVSIGTYCGVIQKRILVSTCPLPKGACMWQDREDKLCRFTHEEMTPAEFCARVHGVPPNQGEVEARKVRILNAFKQEITSSSE